MRARDPDTSGFIERDGVAVHYEVFGDGAPTVMMLPTWSIVHSRVWKAQVPYLARHFRVVTFDGRGCGRSGRPVGAAAYTREQFADDAVAVLDATSTDAAVLVGLSAGARWGIRLAADHPGRVLGFVSIAPAAPLVPDNPGRAAVPFDEPFESTSGWAKFNSHFWQHDYGAFVAFFIGRIFTEAHSTKPIEDAVGWGLDNDATTLADTWRGILATDPVSFREDCTRVTCPVLVIHGDEDAVRPHAAGVALAELTHGRLVTIVEGGHAPNARDPVVVNRLIREFVESVALLDKAGHR
jgi:pimeloyl-ACP methyl ester carboxylesterase